MILEATLELLRAQFTVRLRLKRQLPLLLKQKKGTTGNIAEIHRVRRALHIAERRLPWKSLCLPNAIAAGRMMIRRNIPFELALGVGMEPQIHAHAWVGAGGIIVTGRSGMNDVQQILTSVPAEHQAR